MSAYAGGWPAAMFHVQRFTAEEDEEEQEESLAAATNSDKDVLLNKLLEKAKARAKHARVEPSFRQDDRVIAGKEVAADVDVAGREQSGANRLRASSADETANQKGGKKLSRKERRAQARREKIVENVHPNAAPREEHIDIRQTGAAPGLEQSDEALRDTNSDRGRGEWKNSYAKEDVDAGDSEDESRVQHRQREKKTKRKRDIIPSEISHDVTTTASDEAQLHGGNQNATTPGDRGDDGIDRNRSERQQEREDEDRESELRPMEQVAAEWGLDKRLAQTLREEGVKHFFPIQVRVVPDIVATERHSHVQSRDMCVSAPTGSGKTLVFALGVLQGLIRRRVVRLRALVLLPSRDLAMQVHAVFQRYARGTGLKVGLAIGQTNFLEEQLALVGNTALMGDPVATAKASLLRGQGHRAGSDPAREYGVDFGEEATTRVPVGGASEVDVVVATPGRLLDHLEKTPGFTLQHLRYLVIDEADRLLNQSYQGWVGKVIKAAYRREPGKAGSVHQTFVNDKTIAESQLPTALRLEPVTVRGRPLATGDRVRGATVATPPLRKLLFSATLTSNPAKLAGLDVINPIIYTAKETTRRQTSSSSTQASGVPRDMEAGLGDGSGDGKRPSQKTRRSNLDQIMVGGGDSGHGTGRFSTPSTLEEAYTVCDSQAKPLVLLSLLRDKAGRQKQLTVVFTSSVDSTHRLFRLLQLFGGFDGNGVKESGDRGGQGELGVDSDGGVAEFSSSLGQRHRNRIIKRARDGLVRVIVCSDGMARGMDLEGVGLVVNYDVPSHAKTYVHRVGRTARAGCRGTAVTITKKGQVKQFLKMRARVDRKRLRADLLPAEQSQLLPLVGRYQRCLEDLKEVLEAEKSGELDPASPVTAVDDA